MSLGFDRDVARRQDYAMTLLAREPVTDGGHPASTIERVAKSANLTVQQVRSAIKGVRGR